MAFPLIQNLGALANVPIKSIRLSMIGTARDNDPQHVATSENHVVIVLSFVELGKGNQEDDVPVSTLRVQSIQVGMQLPDNSQDMIGILEAQKKTYAWSHIQLAKVDLKFRPGTTPGDVLGSLLSCHADHYKYSTKTSGCRYWWYVLPITRGSRSLIKDITSVSLRLRSWRPTIFLKPAPRLMPLRSCHRISDATILLIPNSSILGKDNSHILGWRHMLKVFGSQ